MIELRRILFVEDDSVVHQLIDLSLGTIGQFEVYGFLKGSDAVAAAAKIDPDFILLDVMMPDMDGPSVWGELSKIDGFACRPFAFLTAKRDPNDVKKLYALGAACVMSKPFDPMRLPLEIQRLWEAHHGLSPKKPDE
jgi:DNA-binding response OmpR family regulator